MKSKQISLLASLKNPEIPKTRVAQFLSEMNQIIPFSDLASMIDTHIEYSKRGRPRKETEMMLRCLCLQQWYSQSDPELQDSINDRSSFQEFLGLDMAVDQAPDETTICKFRLFLQEHHLFKKLFEMINIHLKTKGLVLKQGTLVDATIIKAPSSTKNQSGKRDPEMGPTKKGNDYHFGMKTHIGVDKGSGIVHSIAFSTASHHDSRYLKDLVHGEEEVVFADKAYHSKHIDEFLEQQNIQSMILYKGSRNKSLSIGQIAMNKILSKLRAPVEYPFGIVKNIWGYRKVRYKGIYKNACQQYLLYGLANLYTSRKKLLAMC